MPNPTKTSAGQIYYQTYQTIKKTPVVYLPFLIFAVFEIIAVALVYLFPRMPFVLVCGPIIRTFWGERFLHYPINFLLLPKLAALSRMFLSVILGSLLTGMAVAIVYKKNYKTAFKKYISLFLIVLIITGLFYLTVKIIGLCLNKYFMAGHLKLLFLGPRIWLGPILTTINLVTALLVQSIFVYAIPEVILNEENPIKCIGASFVFFKKHTVLTLILVGLPMLIYLPVVVLNYNTAFLIYRIFPEVILFLALSGAIISSLIIDPAITISTALLYLKSKEK